MKTHRHNGTLVISVEGVEINELTDKILEELKAQGILDTGNVFRGVKKGNLQKLLEFGTDRTEERGFNYWLRQNASPDLCTSCNSRYNFDDVVKEVPHHLEKKLRVQCPYYSLTRLDLLHLEYRECPIYMAVAGGPRVFYGSDNILSGTDEEIIIRFISVMIPPEPQYTHLIVYDAKGVEPFDLERFKFKEGVKPTDILKAIIATEEGT